MNLLFALLFSILYFLTALALVLLGKEAPIFATAGLGYLVASLIVLWGGYFFVQRRRPRHPRLLFFSLGALVFGSVFPLFYATEAYDDYRDNRKRDDFRRTEVFDLSDELFVTQRGPPLAWCLRPRPCREAGLCWFISLTSSLAPSGSTAATSASPTAATGPAASTVSPPM
jgi:hypothetical protein